MSIVLGMRKFSVRRSRQRFIRCLGIDMTLRRWSSASSMAAPRQRIRFICWPNCAVWEMTLTVVECFMSPEAEADPRTLGCEAPIP